MKHSVPTTDVVRVLAALRLRAPRVQCLTNTVAQALTANVLHALGARASMATHRDEIVAMTRTADAVLINLGTPDDQRISGLSRLIETDALRGKVVVLDPVFAHASPLRRDMARRLLAATPTIVKGNADEIAALRDIPTALSAIWITTGAVDRIEAGDRSIGITGGHRWMSTVTGMGCALGAVVAAVVAVADDPIDGASVAVTTFKNAATAAAHDARGPGSFAVAFLDQLERLSLHQD